MLRDRRCQPSVYFDVASARIGTPGNFVEAAKVRNNLNSTSSARTSASQGALRGGTILSTCPAKVKRFRQMFTRFMESEYRASKRSRTVGAQVIESRK